MPALRWTRLSRHVWQGVGTDMDDTSGIPPDRDTSHIQYGRGGNDQLTGFSRVVNNIYAGDGNDIISMNATGRLCGFGGAGDDRINGGGQADCLYGGDGADAIKGLHGNDTLAGGDSADDLLGGDGDDLIYASIQGPRPVSNPAIEWPTVAIELAADIVRGGIGNETIWGAGGGMTAHGEAGNDRFCVTNSDTLYGDIGDDEFFFGVRDAQVHRANTTCQAFGGQGSDRFYVDDSQSILIEAFGGAGNDTFHSRTVQRNHFVGGGGADSFVIEQSFAHGQRFYYNNVQDSTRTAADVIAFANNVTGLVNIMLDDDSFASRTHRAVGINNEYVALIFLDRNNQELYIAIDRAARWTAELFTDAG
jgi:Ca2+-binding RTX toxin-like protein